MSEEIDKLRETFEDSLRLVGGRVPVFGARELEALLAAVREEGRKRGLEEARRIALKEPSEECPNVGPKAYYDFHFSHWGACERVASRIADLIKGERAPFSQRDETWAQMEPQVLARFEAENARWRALAALEVPCPGVDGALCVLDTKVAPGTICFGCERRKKT